VIHDATHSVKMAVLMSVVAETEESKGSMVNPAWSNTRVFGVVVRP